MTIHSRRRNHWSILSNTNMLTYPNGVWPLNCLCLSFLNLVIVFVGCHFACVISIIRKNILDAIDALIMAISYGYILSSNWASDSCWKYCMGKLLGCVNIGSLGDANFLAAVLSFMVHSFVILMLWDCNIAGVVVRGRKICNVWCEREGERRCESCDMLKYLLCGDFVAREREDVSFVTQFLWWKWVWVIIHREIECGLCVESMWNRHDNDVWIIIHSDTR